jgi:hypothetical protein
MKVPIGGSFEPLTTELAQRGGRERLAALLLRTALRITVRPVLSPRISIKRQRWWLRRIALMGRPTPDQQTVEAGTIDGVSGEWIRPLQLSAATERGAAILSPVQCERTFAGQADCA